MTPFKDLFISYGRRESLSLVGRLHQQLKLKGYDAWFDKVNIPDGEDYVQRINHGIESAHNFVYIMAPRCLTSPYCLMELEYARFLGKRVIPINQMVIFQTAAEELSANDQHILHQFYQHYHIPDPNLQTTQEVLTRSHALIGKTDWLDAKEQLSDDDCEQLKEWAQTYENHWHQHDDRDYLTSLELPVFGQSIDTLASVVERLIMVLERHTTYVHQHTQILAEALLWQQNHCLTRYLPVGKERTAAEQWLLTTFSEAEQPPCQPNELQCQFICEACKNAENMLTDGFICYEIHHDRAIRDQIMRSLSRYAITTWTHDKDIQTGTDYTRKIQEGIENADNFLYFISPYAVTSAYCQQELTHALQYHKRIIPLLITATPAAQLPKAIQHLQYIDFTTTDPLTYQRRIDDLLKIITEEAAYYEQHKRLLVRALKWVAEDHQPAFLLRGYNLDNAQTWLRLYANRTQQPPTELHHELIRASEAAKGQLSTEIFISYSRKDGDFARQLNLTLQEAGKTTWFDQESLSSGVDFETEIFKGIASSDNFIFIISPDAVESEYCEREVNYAHDQGKRFIPILFRATDPATMPMVLRKIQWLNFHELPFDQAFPELIQAIELDREHTQHHTVLQQRANEWSDNQCSPDFLLNPSACSNAEAWLQVAQAEHKQPQPTELQTTFIQDSRAAIVKAEQAVNRRRRIAFTSVTAGMIMALILAAWAVSEMYQAQRAQQQAQSFSLVSLSQREVKKGDITNGILLALEGLPRQISNPDRPYVPQLVDQLYQAVVKHQEQGVLVGHQDTVTQAVFSSDGQWIASAGEDKVIRLWEAQSGQLYQVLIGHTARINHVAFSPDGRQIVTASDDNTARLWEVSSGQLIYTLSGHESSIYHAAFSPDGRQVVTASDDDTACLWNVSSGQLIHIQHGHESDVNHAAFSPDGRQIVTASDDQTARLWNVSSGQLIHTLSGHKDYVNHATFSPDGHQVVTTSDDQTARLWNVSSGQLIHTLSRHEDYVNYAVFNPNGHQVVTASDDNTARLWDVSSGRLIHTLRGHDSDVNHVAFSPDGYQVVTVSDDQTARLWDVLSGQLIHNLHGHESSVYHAAFSPDGRQVVTASDDQTARLWNVLGSQLSYILSGHKDGVKHAAFSPDGHQIVTASDDNTARLWNVSSSQLSHTLRGHKDGVRHATFSPNGRQVVTASRDHTARLWDVSSGQLTHILSGHEALVWHAAFSPDGRQVITVSDDNTAQLWDVSSGQLIYTLSGHESSVYHAAFSPDGRQVITASDDNTARLWNISSGQLIHILHGHESDVNQATFSPDGRQVVTASDDNTARLWNVSSGQLIYILHGHESTVIYAAFSPDGHRVVTASYDNTARLWDVPSGQLIHTLRGHESLVTYAAFNLDGSQVVTASFDQTARRWRVFFTQELIDYANKQVPRCLTPQQREFFLFAAHEGHILQEQGEQLAHKGQIKQAAKTFQQAQQLLPCLKFDPQDRAQQLAAQALINEGRETVKKDPTAIATASAKFQQASQIDARFSLIAENYARSLAAHALIKEGNELVEQKQIAEALVKFQQAQKIDAQSPANQVAAQVLIRQGEQLARDGEIEAAVTRFKQALEYDAQLEIDPKIKAKQTRVAQLMMEGRKLVKENQVDAAITQFQQALEFDPSLDFDLNTKVQEVQNPTLLVEKGQQLAHQGEIEKALASYREARVFG